jgi:DNA-binding IclR family transcriptional regulator
MSIARGEGGPSIADRMFTVLEACAASRRPLTLVELCELTGLPKSTLHRVCWKLVDMRVLLHTHEGFEMGARLYALGAMSPALRRLRAAALPLLHALAAHSRWIANLGVLCDERALIVDEIAGSVQLAPRARMVGAGLPLYATALGKAMLANGPADVREGQLGPPVLRPFTRHTIVRTSVLRENLATVALRGYAISNEELRLGVSGVAAPVIVDGTLVAAIALVGPPDETALRQLSGHVRLAATRLAEALAPAPVQMAA